MAFEPYDDSPPAYEPEEDKPPRRSTPPGKRSSDEKTEASANPVEADPTPAPRPDPVIFPDAPDDDRPVVLWTQELTKRFGKAGSKASKQERPALDRLDLEIREGDIFGFIGPNGAGKTTTIRILTTLLEPSSGKAEICGYSLKHKRAIRSLVGYMPDAFGVYENMSLYEYLEFFAAAYSVSRQKRGGVIDDVLALTDLAPKRDDRLSAFSKGMKQRACLAKTLLHNPRVLILDEPASGLDPRARVEFRELLLELRRMGKTILVSSHILSELSSVCNKIGIIEAGRLVASGPVDKILSSLRSAAGVQIRLLRADDAERAVAMLQSIDDVEQVEAEGRQLEVRSVAGTEEALAKLVRRLIEAGIELSGFREESVDLETAFLRWTRGDLR